MKSDKWTNDKWVNLIASGHKWFCPNCCTCNVEIVFENLVECSKCGESFRVEDKEEKE